MLRIVGFIPKSHKRSGRESLDMTPFGYLIIAHLIGDYLFQTSWMAMNKATKWIPLLVHCVIYTLSIVIIAYFGFGGLSWIGILFVFITHVIIDKRTFVVWWAETIMGAKTKETAWLKIVVDQVFHIIILAIALHL